MQQRNRFALYRGLLWLLLFVFWTALVQSIDVRPIGPENSSVGLAQLNASFHQLTGVHMNLCLLTDWLSLIPAFIMLLFALVGLIQWVSRRHILKVDSDILLLGMLFLAVFAVYLLFEKFPVNHRPVLIDGFLEASYPSSTTLLILTVMPASVLQVRRRVSSAPLRTALIALIASIAFFTASMVLLRLLSGVHWLADVIGGALISAALTELYTFSVSALVLPTNCKR